MVLFDQCTIMGHAVGIFSMVIRTGGSLFLLSLYERLLIEVFWFIDDDCVRAWC